MNKYAYVIFDLDVNVTEGAHLATSSERRRRYDAPSPQQYLFENPFPFELEADDLVVVDTRNGFQIAKFVRYSDTIPESLNDRTIKSLVAKIDLEAFEAHKRKIEKLKELKREMDAKVESLKEQAVYEMMAEKDDSLAKVLAEYNALLGE